MLRLLILLLPLPLAAAPSLALSLHIVLSGLLSPQITADAQNNIIVAGMVSECSRPVVKPISSCGAYWIEKLDPTGSTILFATYIGGPVQLGQTRAESLRDVRVDRLGNIVILSTATRTSLPAVNAIQPAVKGDSNLHLCKLASDGSRFLFATYLGGSGSDFALALALDDSGAAYINAFSRSFDFPGAPPFVPNPSDGLHLLVKVSPDGQRLVYVSAFTPQYEGASIRVDAFGSAQLSSLSEILKFSPDGKNIQSIPLPEWTRMYSIPLAFLTSDGGYWVAATAFSSVLPVTPDAFQPSDMPLLYLRIEQGQVSGAARPMTGYRINSFTVDPVERFRIYASTTTGLFKSEDNGWTWDQIYPSGVQSVLVDPFDQNTLYLAAASYSADGVLFRSTDRGQTWAPWGQDLRSSLGSSGISLSADPHTPGKLYIASGSFYRSEDGGEHWEGGTGWGPPLPPQMGGSGNLSTKANGVTADPRVAGRVYVQADTSCIGFCGITPTLAQSDDGGATFVLLKYAFGPVIDPSTGDIFAPNFAPGKLAVFRNANFDIPELLDSPGQIMVMTFDPQTPGTLYLSLDDGDIFSSADGARNFQHLVTLPLRANTAVGDGGVIHASQAISAIDGFAFKFDSSGNVVYGTYFGGGATTVKAAALAPNGHFFIAGVTGPGLPLANAIQPAFGGATDGFLAEFDASGKLVSSTYLGGPGNDEVDSITVLFDGSVLAVGSSAPPGTPYAGPADAMIWRIRP